MTLASIEIRLCDEDREKYKGPEWTSLDVEALFDTPASLLERWEAETGYPVERAIADCAEAFPPAIAVRVLVWLARKQHGSNAGVFTNGEPERFADLADIRTIKVRMRAAEDDADPPDQSEQTTPEPSSTDDPSASSSAP